MTFLRERNVLPPVGSLLLSFDLGLSVPEIEQIHGIRLPEFIWSGLSLAHNLNGAAREIAYAEEVGILYTAFNGFITITCATNATIARCLYLTVRLHVLQMVSEATESLNFESIIERLYNTTYTTSLVAEIASVLDTVPSRTEGQVSKEPGMGFRAFSLFWPMMVVLRTKLTDELSRAWVLEKLQKTGSAAGFGLAAMASKG